MEDFPHRELTYAIIGACFEVYNEMGPGFLESVYQECLAIELVNRGIEVATQVRRKLHYKGMELRTTYIPDFLIDGKVIIELKAVDLLLQEHRAQVINYLSATRLDLALLVNFGASPKLQYERIVNSHRSQPTASA